MRENIGLFRGKRIDNGECVEGNLLYDIENNRAFIAEDFEDNAAYIREVDPDTIGECTGLKDKNGKLIFEGDIVEIRERGHLARGTVVFENAYPGGWLVADAFYKHSCSLAMRTDVEICGTIHDNPELLKGGEGE